MILLERPKIFNELNLFVHNTEIRELDGDMQRLVYENYSKFIKATDMIREVFEPHPRSFVSTILHIYAR